MATAQQAKATSSPQGKPVSGDANMICTWNVITNKTVSPVSQASKLVHGDWVIMPTAVSAGTTPSIAFQSRGQNATLFGTQGFANYSADDGTTFVFTFDVPYNGQNTYSVSLNGPAKDLWSAVFMNQILYSDNGGCTVVLTYNGG